MDASANPIRQVYTELWDLLEASSQFISVVGGTGNRIRQDGTTYMYEKDALSDADCPQVQVVLAGHKTHLQATTNDSFLTTIWEIQVATGDMRFVSVLDVFWAIYCAVENWAPTVGALTWQEKTFAHLCRPLKVQETVDGRQISPGNRGWVAMWRGEVEMHFTTTDLNTAASS